MPTKGTYTITCPQCRVQVLVHLGSDGSISPLKCTECEVKFGGIDNGEQRGTFVGLIKKEEKKIEIVANEEAEEDTKKTGKKSSKKKKERKDFGAEWRGGWGKGWKEKVKKAEVEKK